VRDAVDAVDEARGLAAQHREQRAGAVGAGAGTATPAFARCAIRLR
jgi:hypothetical protein